MSVFETAMEAVSDWKLKDAFAGSPVSVSLGEEEVKPKKRASKKAAK